ncbi:sugar phosphate isomerase/epimerase [Porifericola rhodea]|uniref:sugar phosphate isomerase/epimerase family protein n=1 Tax=Porifericola rhodea TaxID=930972 RepID=UPI002665CB97|nr:sugar phosphate isomerase/epimerase family protein [Porifericola rhodea]WKN29822.1 sugar phosphate isomerase/epimerase [Porifericola rhodea]
MNRRRFLKTSGCAATALPVLSGLPTLAMAQQPNLKLALNAFSFNQALREGSMNLESLLEYCANLPFAALDATAYYFPGYPLVPDDATLYSFKHKAYTLGLSICGTGVRNDFAQRDSQKRKEDLKLVENWIAAAARLGTPCLRVFAGKTVEDRSEWKRARARLIDGLRQSADVAAQYGVMLNLQNHYEFLKTANEVEDVLLEIDHPYLGLMLDIGSLRAKPYQEIKQLAPYARSWQVKEEVYVNGKAEKTNIERIVEIARAVRYRGYFPLETLGPGDPKAKVQALLQEAQAALSS